MNIKEVRKAFRKNIALDGITANIHDRQIVGLIGANGSGKTTLMKICAGLENADSGMAGIDGMDVAKDIRAAEEIIYSMHDLPVGSYRKISEIIRYYDAAYQRFDQTFCRKLLELFGIPEKRAMRTLSQGMKSLVHFSCALATRCRVTLLDEPLTGVDIEKRKIAYEILLREYMEHPRMIMVSSHNLFELEGVLSEMLLIDRGKLIFYQEMDAVREMLFRVDGGEGEIQEFAEGKETVSMAVKGMGSYAVLKGPATGAEAQEARRAGLSVSAVTPEDVSVYLTASGVGKEIDSLWED